MTETFPLYNGDVVLEFNPGNHQYHAVIKGRRFKVPGVTTALESLAKPALIPWAVNTTLDFVRAAVSPGVEHAESYLEEVYAKAKRSFRDVKRSAADIGTSAHTILQLPDQERPVLESIGDERVRNCVSAGLAWLSSREVEWIYQERPVYSRRHRYSGRCDGLARVDGLLTLIDWKSSNGIYPEYRLQCAAYCHALEEEFPDQRIEQRILIRLGKEDGAFEPHVYPRKTLRKDFNAFLAALKIHTRMKEIEKEEKKK